MLEIRQALAHSLDQSILDLMEILRALPCEAPQNPATGWLVKDVVSHLIGWDMALIKSLEAHQTGGEYLVAESHDAYNAEQADARRGLPGSQIVAEFVAVRLKLKGLLMTMPDERLATPLAAPWGGKKAVNLTVRDLIGHDAHHLDELRAVLAGLGHTH